MDMKRIQIAVARADLILAKYGKSMYIIGTILVLAFIVMAFDWRGRK